MSPWSAPGADQRGPAFLQAPYTYHGADVSGVLNSIMRERELQQKQISDAAQSAAKSVGSILQQNRQDQMAQALLDQGSGYDSDQPTGEQMFIRSLNESDMAPSDAWKTFQDLKNERMKIALAGSQVDHNNALADYYNAGADNRVNRQNNPPIAPSVQLRRDIHDDSQARQQLADNLGVPLKDLPATIGKVESYVPGTTEWPLGNGNSEDGGRKQAQIDAVRAYRARAQQVGQPQTTLPESGGDSDPNAPAAVPPQPGAQGDAKRAQAIKTLQDNNQPVTERNIQYVIGQL